MKSEVPVIPHTSYFILTKVSDTGQGIPKDKLDKVFDKFGQVAAKKSGNVRSTGLGLTFCKMAVEAHGGQIDVESEMEKGTTFLFTLPIGGKLKEVVKSEAPATMDTLKLSENDEIVLKPYLAKLQSLLVYETTDIEKILGTIEAANSITLQKWKQEMEDVLFTLNEERYQKLINTAKQE